MNDAVYQKVLNMAAKASTSKKYRQFDNMHDYKCKICNKDFIMGKIEHLINHLNQTKPYTRSNIGQNKWIVKPSAGSKGKNIKIFNDINDITS